MGGPPVVYRSQESAYSGVNKVIDFATRSIFPDVFMAAQELVTEENYEPDIKLYTALIQACANFPGCLLQELAFNLLDEMKGRGMVPDSVIYHHLLRVGFLWRTGGGLFNWVGGRGGRKKEC